MSDVCCVYSSKELAKLDTKARRQLQNELKNQIQASPEIRAIVRADAEVKKILKEKLRATYDKLSRG
jgi:hypothetical protein